MGDYDGSFTVFKRIKRDCRIKKSNNKIWYLVCLLLNAAGPFYFRYVLAEENYAAHTILNQFSDKSSSPVLAKSRVISKEVIFVGLAI